MRKLGLVLAALLFASQVQAEDVSKFQANTVSELQALCSASDTDDHGRYALGFCYGWIVGIGQFYEQLLIDERFGFTPRVCPNKDLTRNEVRLSFLNWVQANPGSGERPALSGFIDAMREAYPCK